MSVSINYRAGYDNKSTNALSRSPAAYHGIAQDEAQVSALTTTGSETPMSQDLSALSPTDGDTPTNYQVKDPDLSELILYLEHDKLPERSGKLVAKVPQFALVGGILK